MQAFALTVWANYFEMAGKAMQQGYFSTAETMFAAAVNEAETFDLNPFRQAASLHGLACAQRAMGQYVSSDVHLRKAFRILCQGEDINADDLSALACLLADSYRESNQNHKALPVLKAAAQRIVRAEGSGSPALVPLLKRIGWIYWQGQRNDKALMTFEKMMTLVGH